MVNFQVIMDIPLPLREINAKLIRLKLRRRLYLVYLVSFGLFQQERTQNLHVSCQDTKSQIAAVSFVLFIPAQSQSVAGAQGMDSRLNARMPFTDLSKLRRTLSFLVLSFPFLGKHTRAIIFCSSTRLSWE
jgi:hypothetical protein